MRRRHNRELCTGNVLALADNCDIDDNLDARGDEPMQRDDFARTDDGANGDNVAHIDEVQKLFVSSIGHGDNLEHANTSSKPTI